MFCANIDNPPEGNTKRSATWRKASSERRENRVPARMILQTLRDFMTVSETVEVAKHLEPSFQALLFDGWRPLPLPRDLPSWEIFVSSVRQKCVAVGTKDVEPVIADVLNRLAGGISHSGVGRKLLAEPAVSHRLIH